MTSLDQIVPYIGFVNRCLIEDWNGRVKGKPLHLLSLPAPSPRRGVAFSPSADSLDQFATEHPALRALWLRFLGADAWAARLREALATAAKCSERANMASVLRGAHCELGASLADSVLSAPPPQGPHQQQQASDVMRAVLANAPNLAAAVAESEARLLARLPRFLDSKFFKCYERLQRVTPSAVSLNSFTLLRLYGRGSYIWRRLRCEKGRHRRPHRPEARAHLAGTAQAGRRASEDGADHS